MSGSVTLFQRDIVTNYFLWVGQSLARGADGALSTTQPYWSRMWNQGVLTTGGTNEVQVLTNFLPLVEVSKETAASGFANEWFDLCARNSFHANYAQNGAGYSVLKKGGTGSNYALSVASVVSAKALVFLNVPAILCVHGESDSVGGYDSKIEDWQTNYETDIQAVTGQTGRIPMFHSQVVQGNLSSLDMLDAHETDSTKSVLVCPKYFFDYPSDTLHIDNLGTRALGEYYAKAVHRLVVLGQTYNPLRPIAISTAANVISITFTGMIGLLTFDTNWCAFQTNYGFEYIESGGPTITNVAITNATNTVQISLSAAPVNAATAHIAYAFTGATSGRTTGKRGNLRDSDPTVGRDGFNLYDWCVHFYKPLNGTWP